MYNRCLSFKQELTEEGFKKRFQTARREVGESPLQFITRLRNYLDRWISMAELGESVDELKNFLVKEQYYTTCDKELATFLRERSLKDLASVARVAEQYLDARGGDGTSRKPASHSKETESEHGSQKDRGTMSSGSKPDGFKETRACYVCGKKGHLAKDCYKRVKAAGFGQRTWAPRSGNSYRPEDSQPEVTQPGANGHSGGTIEQRRACRAHKKVGCDECLAPVEGTGHVCGLLARPELTLECGCKIPVLACGRQQRYNNLETVEGKVNGQSGQVLRDTGCSTVVVRRSLVDEDQLTGKKVTCVMIDGTAKTYETAEIEVETPFFNGVVTAVCMERPLYDLIIGNIPEVKAGGRKRDKCVGLAVVTRAQSQKSKTETKLKVLNEVDTEMSVDQLKKMQTEDGSLRRFWEEAKEHADNKDREGAMEKCGILYRRRSVNTGRMVTQLIVPVQLRQKVMELAHDQALGGHLGKKKTLERVQAHFYWPGVQGDVDRWCRSCDICQRMEAKGRVGKAPMGVMPIIETPFRRVAIDLIEPSSPITSRGNRYILTLVDYATRYPEATALKNIETGTVAEALVEMFTRIGVPEEMLSDQGSQFTGGIMKEISRLLSMKHLLTTPYNPKCNGLVERYNGTLKAMLRKLCCEKPQDWDRYLPAVLFAYREVPQESLGFSPFELVYGRVVRGPMQILKELWTKERDGEEVQTLYQYVVDLKERLQSTCELAHQELQRAQKKQKTWYDKKARKRTLQAGDKVLLLLPTDHNKLTMAWKGPFEVLKRVTDVDYVIQMAGKQKNFHVNMLKKYVERELTEMDQEPEQEIHQVGAVIQWEDEASLELIKTQQQEFYTDVDINPALDNSVKTRIQSLLYQYQDIFSDVPGQSVLGEHRITLTSDTPVRSKAYPIPFALRERVDKELDEMLRLGIIEKSEAAYASPIVVVTKPDLSLRICADFRKLNEQTVFDPEPIPTADEIFAQLAGDRILSKFDMAKGYWQIKVRDSDMDFTTIITHRGLFRFRTMPFGLVGAPATYTRMMRQLLDRLENIHNYLDDCLAHSAEWGHHFRVLEGFFQRVREAGLTLRPKKCAIGYSTVTYLGFVLSPDGLRPTPDKIDKILKAPSPKTKKQLRSFLGLTGYYRAFVPNFSEIVVSLVDLTKKGKPNLLQWTEVHEEAFTALKQSLASTPILRLADMSKPFLVQTDASDVGLGASLVQSHDGCRHPVTFASKLLLPRERNYAVVERECLAIVWALEKFQNFLFGREFILETDHAPLQYLRRAQYQNSRLMRWALTLEQYKFVVRYIKGSENVCADYLSRMWDTTVKDEEEDQEDGVDEESSHSSSL